MTLTSNMHLNRGDTTIGVKITGTYQPRDSAGPHRVINIEACDDHGEVGLTDDEWTDAEQLLLETRTP